VVLQINTFLRNNNSTVIMKRYIFYSILVLAASACKISNMEASKAKTNTAHQTGYALVNGLNLYYEIYGEGRPLVLIHGGGSTIQTTFGKILPLLAQTHKVIAVELQAHGHTKDRDAPESFQQDANDVAALLRYLKIDKADVMGFSNGGQTTMQMGISYPVQVNKLVIISAFYKREGAVKGFFESMEKATIKDMPAIYKEAYLKINNDSAGLERMFEKDRARMVQFKDWSDEDLSSIKADCLIIMGDKDVATPEHAVEMKHKIPNSELLILPGNHGSFIGEIMFEEQDSQIPALTVAVIEEFLSK
jgi:pimeloyl-ACP methyl ester carboxylesterase